VLVLTGRVSWPVDLVMERSSCGIDIDILFFVSFSSTIIFALIDLLL